MEANRFADLGKARNYFRFWKKGLVFGILYGLVWSVISFILSLIMQSLGVPVTTLMAAVQAGGIGIGITVLVALVVQLSVGGFLIEFINNNSSKLIRWVRK